MEIKYYFKIRGRMGNGGGVGGRWGEGREEIALGVARRYNARGTVHPSCHTYYICIV